jgi:hypothetical protein
MPALCVFLLAYLALISSKVGLDYLVGIPWIIFLVIMVFEHLVQEVFRLLVVLNRQIAGSIVMFIKSGLWAYTLFVQSYVYGLDVDLDGVLEFWSTSAVAAFIVGILFLRSATNNYSFISFRFSSAVVPLSIRYLRRSFVFYGPSILGRAPFFIDKIIVAYFVSVSQLGAYSICFSIVISLISIHESAVASFYFPRFIRMKGNAAQLRSLLRSYVKLTGAMFFFVGIAIQVVVYEYEFFGLGVKNMMYVLWVLYFSVLVCCISTGFHYVLYATGNDTSAMKASYSFPLSFLFVSFLVIFNENSGPSGSVPIMVSLSFFVSYVVQAAIRYRYAIAAI